MKNYYEMLSVAPAAPAEEIKKAFRREIARYHPDKVQHLGAEFQDMAAGIAADLTEAYRILMDPALRTRYDAELGAAPHTAPVAPPRQAATPPPAAPPDSSQPVEPPPPAPPRRTAGVDFVRRVALSKFRDAVNDVLGSAEPFAAPGFDVAVATRPRKGLFRKADEALCVVVKFVAFVDAAAVADAWLPAAKIKGPEGSACVLILLGPGLAPARDLAAAVSEQRRRSRGGGPLLIPVDVRDWEALFPPETPAAVRSLIQRLKDEKS